MIKSSELKLKEGQSAITWVSVRLGEDTARAVTRIGLKSIGDGQVTLTIEQDAQEGTNEAL